MVGIGAGAAAGYEQLAGRVKGAGYLFVAVAALAVLALWALKRAFLKREQAHMRLEGESGDQAGPS